VKNCGVTLAQIKTVQLLGVQPADPLICHPIQTCGSATGVLYACLSCCNEIETETAGSPFSIWASSASLIKVTGPGVEHGVLSTFKSVFEVDATEAGPGDLKVRVGGRRGNSVGHFNIILFE